MSRKVPVNMSPEIYACSDVGEFQEGCILRRVAESPGTSAQRIAFAEGIGVSLV
jgi:hypothetical protein